MKNPKKSKKQKILSRTKSKARARKAAAAVPGSILDYHTELLHMKRTVEKLQDLVEKNEERLQDMEIHVNLLTRLLTTLCIEKLGIRVGVLKRMIKRIEKEAIRDSQILHLEELYKMPPHSDKKNASAPQPPPSKNDPWEDIS